MNWVVLDPFESKHDQIMDHILDGLKYFVEYKNRDDTNFGLLSEINNENYGGCRYISLAKLAGTNRLFSGATVFLVLSNSLNQDETGIAVGILNGNIIIDTVVDSENVNKKLDDFNNLCERSSRSFELYGDYPDLLRDYDKPYTLSDLIGNKRSNQKSYVKPLRSNRFTLRFVVVIAIVLIITAIDFFWSWHLQREKTLLETLQQSRQTPEAQYQEAISTFLTKNHYIANVIFKQIKGQIIEIPTKFHGWTLKAITCDLPSCTFTWVTSGGAFNDFQNNAPKKWVDISPAGETSLIGDLKTLSHTYHLDLDPIKLPPKDQWLSSSEFAWNLGNLWQRLAPLGWVGTLNSAVLQEVPPEVQHTAIQNSPYAIWGIPWAVNNQPFWLIDGLGEFSGNVVLQKIEISVDGENGAATFKAAGMAYVKK